MVGDSSGLWKGAEGLSEEDQVKAKSYYSNQKEVRILKYGLLFDAKK